MLKSKIRKKILKIREKKDKGNFHIKFGQIYNFLKKNNYFKKKDYWWVLSGK